MYWQGFLGLLIFPAIAWAFSENRRKVLLKAALIALAVQVALAGILLKFPYLQEIFQQLNKAVLAIQEATAKGTSFVFGYLGGGPAPFEMQSPGSDFILAFRALPLLLVISALSALLFYWRILPYLIRGFSWLLQKVMRIGGALGLVAAANIFVGMTEAPLFIRPYLKELTHSELFGVMVCGMATIAGTMLAVYVSILGPVIPDIAGHLLIASVISVPAAISMALLMVPETGKSTAGSLIPSQQADSAMDAVTKGALDGIQLLLNIIAMLVVFVALVHLANQFLGLLPDIGGEPVNLQRILGVIMAPAVWLMGIPWAEAHTAGALMGTKTVLNEFIAYLNLAQLPEGTLSARSNLIMTYALCGFANLGSLGIMIGGLGTLAPERRGEIVALGMKSIVAGTLATCMTGVLAGLFYA
ncbi:MAG: nucleoside:proton symporter [Gammaproteobacteria bacterium]|nr:nucleoside:proton symporter [Gammaproteobacteria bacterium]